MMLNTTKKIILYCVQPKRFSSICMKVGWNSGAIGVTLRRLMKSGHIQKVERGVYQATSNGIKHIMLEFEMEEPKNTKAVIDQAAFVLRIKLRKKNKGNTKLESNIDDILSELRKIYFGSVSCDHKNSKIVRMIWAMHESMICKDHNFNFKQTFKKHAKMIKPLGEKDVFYNLHLYSLDEWEQNKEILKRK